VTCLVDASILSEPTKPLPSERVIKWLRHNEREIAIDPIVLGEVRFGILLLPKLRASGKSMPIKDSLIAATALTHGLAVASRNASDFEHAGVEVVNPFEFE
jgi:predicted nucleic acid-binding protein